MKSALKILFVLLVVLTSSCKKEFKETQEKMALLTKRSGWITLKVEKKSSTGTWLDITGTPLPHEKDNALIFDPWYKWAIDAGLLKLPGDAQIIAYGSWSFVDKGIQIEEGNLMEINELTETSLIVIVNSTTESFRYTYGHP
ncbi:hypothetical protein [Pedobacter insulae]|uniref:Lipocalin-like domain-containing protein n=1 Tax=Pedobacter insulae TaxID=414048 RepID=A0A1I2XA35_9SPHI|nr:hypothetical protein [Pedobacter insulae]SFH10365.1 hypothetical protein SAMN04489864_10595 [Pedobacter insulae]